MLQQEIVDVDKIVFNNIYEAPAVPDATDTGDNTNVWMWGVRMFVRGMVIVAAGVFGRKREKPEE